MGSIVDGYPKGGLRLPTLALAVIVSCLFTMAFGTGVAGAQTTYASVGQLGAGSLGSTPEEQSTAVAIDEATGYVLGVFKAGNRVVVFEKNEPGAPVLTTFGEGELSSPTGIAIDQADGSVYVSDAGNNRIVRYTSDGAVPPTYIRDATYVSPTHGSNVGEVGNFAAQLAVDPTTGDLLVADTGNRMVERFSSSGGFISSFDGSGGPGGAFTGLLDVTVSPDGTIYVVADGTVEAFGEASGSRVERFAADGSSAGPLPASPAFATARAVAFDPRTQSLLVAELGGLVGFPTVAVVRNDQVVQEINAGTPFSALSDLSSPQAGGANVTVLDSQTVFSSETQVELLNIFNLEASISPVSGITGTEAHLAGSVDANEAVEVEAHFEYRAVGAALWTSTPNQPVAASASPEPVEEDISGLLPATEYEVRLTASRPNVSTTTEIIKFGTGIIPPVASTQGASAVTDNAATLNGSVVAEGAPSTYFFEYGTTTAYGSRVPAPEASAGSSRLPKRFSVDIGGLAPSTPYHFRIVAKNGAGSSFGADAEFTTAASATVTGRAYEQVTPVDQKGGNVNGAAGVQALPGGLGISYITTPTGGEAQAAVKEARALSLRGTSDWGPQIHVDPPFNVFTGLNFALTAAVSDDGTHALVISNRALAPGGKEDREVMNLYVKDLRSGSYTFVGKTEGYEEVHNFVRDARHMVIGGAPDFSWVVFWSPATMLPGAPLGALYRWSGSGLEVASATPKPEPAQRYRAENMEMRQVSEDGRRIFFEAPTGVYLREGNQSTPLSVSEVDGNVKGAELYGCSSSGRYVFFKSVRLTADAPEGEYSFYRYDVDSKSLEFVAAVGADETTTKFEKVRGISDDGSTIYWVPGVSGGETDIWRNGQATVLPAPIEGPATGATGTLRISPNGVYAGIQQNGDIYLFNAETRSVSCASCDAGQATGVAEVPTGTPIFEKSGVYRTPQWVGDDGTVFFTTPAALVPADTNGLADVYAYANGRQALISPGNEPYGALFMDISRGGLDVYFLTNQPLVAQDTNRSSDIYDARVDGGFSVQGLVPPPSCAGEACRGPAQEAPAGGNVGSEAIAPSAVKKKSKSKPKACKRAKGKNHKAAKCHKPSKKKPKKGHSKGHRRTAR